MRRRTVLALLASSLFPGACSFPAAPARREFGQPGLAGEADAADRGVPEIPITGHAGLGLEKFDAIMKDILARYDVPGATLSLAQGGKLVLARGYGFAHPERSRRMAPEALFKLASVSKAITGVTILKMVEKGELDLDARVFELLGALRPPRGAEVDPRLYDITVRQLLYHAGGWSGEESGDPFSFERQALRALHAEPPVTPAMLARYMMGRPLDFTPGTRCVYSNFGFMLLGLIVERAADEPYLEGVRPYAEYVREHTLEPMGIRRMRLASGRWPAPGEVEGFGPDDVRVPPTMPITHFASGGWLGSAVDLARLLTSVDGSRGEPFLSAQTIRHMLSPPPPPVRLAHPRVHFGMGWDVARWTENGVLFNKSGGLRGFATFIEHRPNGVNWVALFNRTLGRPKGPEFDREYRTRIRRAIDETVAWPDVDYFQNYP